MISRHNQEIIKSLNKWTNYLVYMIYIYTYIYQVKKQKIVAPKSIALVAPKIVWTQYIGGQEHYTRSLQHTI
jgi:hypothetical protein